MCLKPRIKIRFRPGKASWKTQPSPQWDGPYDCLEDNKFCVYFAPHINDGLVLISHEKNVHVIDSFPISPKYKHGTQPFYATQLPGKGIGLIANTTIRKGETIMKTTPAMLVQFGPHLDYDDDVQLELYARAVQRLPETTSAMFLRQYGGDVIHYRIDNITHTSVAIRDIHPGEELTISYIDGHLPRKDRQKRLQDWGFTCTCAHCSMSAEQVAESDRRMERIYEIEEDLERMVSTGNIDPTRGDELVKLYEEERFETYIGQALTRAALLHSLVGNETMAVRYANMAWEAMAREYGEWHKDTQAMKLLAEEPTRHWSFAALKKKMERERAAEEKAKKAKKEEDGTIAVEESGDGKVLRGLEVKVVPGDGDKPKKDL
ncbi:hypothetical protein OQA88_11957 [Cercophora sp. LCS_1]